MVLEVTTDIIRFTWGSADHLDFVVYNVQVTTVQNGVIDMEQRMATYSNLTPGTEYTLSVEVLFEDSNDNLLLVENQRTSKS